ncbi:ketimine reductase mu-crystallin-like isoform X1 [Ciona intestinalis]
MSVSVAFFPLNKMSGIKIITTSTVRKVLKYEELIPAIERCLVKYSRGKIQQPVRSTVEVEKYEGCLMTMPAYDTVDDVALLKVISLYPKNEGTKNAPKRQSTILYFLPSTGILAAIIEAHLITYMRTAAATAVATKYLAPDNAKVLAIFGAGGQARSHFQTMNIIHKYEEIIVWNHTTENGEKFCQEISETFKNVRFCSSAKEAASNADVIVLVVSSQTPVLKGEWLKEGVHVNGVGACRPTWREMDDECMNQCELYVDSREGALKESGDIIMCQPKKLINGEIGEVIDGRCKVDRNKKTIFKSLGIAAEDLAAGHLVWKNLGNEI